MFKYCILKSKILEINKIFFTLINEIKVIKCDDGFTKLRCYEQNKQTWHTCNPSKNVSSALSQFAIQDPEAIIVISEVLEL